MTEPTVTPEPPEGTREATECCASFACPMAEQHFHADVHIHGVNANPEPVSVPPVEVGRLPDDEALSWDMRDPIEYQFSAGATIYRLLDEGRWDDEGVLLRYAALALMQPKIDRDRHSDAGPKPEDDET